ncbi:MAG: reverse transcriptase domain-containing protein [Anaerolineae bacterium]|nr:reverse transcriptase domain-containing protein [Anaerolineae bacterium]MCO5193064.1 reverse transcriptase domain-containing protein [Anaerolineae bacterium]MCO5206190.1 reverse transcriptase domain-containing protein [Anaerolineae bacterium]
MKTYRHLYPQLCSWENLYRAWRKARKGKRGKPAAATFEFDLETNLVTLHRDLIAKQYQPGAYHSFYIHEPKRRLISAAPFRDRVVHHALCNVIEPIFERSFIYDSYANRVGKGTHRALDRCQQYSRRFRYYLQCDVQQFFPAIDHTILRDILARKIADPDVMWLIDQILLSGRGVLSEQYAMRWFAGDDLLAVHRPRGLPIGNLTSQFWANCYLNELDHFIKRELGCRGLVRYVDDFILFHDEKGALWMWRDQIETKLAALRLTMHPNAQPRPVTEGIPFLGFVIYPTHRLVKRRKVVHYRRRLHNLVAAYNEEEVGQDQVQASVRGWINHVRYGDTWRLRQAVLQDVVL